MEVKIHLDAPPGVWRVVGCGARALGAESGELTGRLRFYSVHFLHVARWSLH